MDWLHGSVVGVWAVRRQGAPLALLPLLRQRRPDGPAGVLGVVDLDQFGEGLVAELGG